MRSATAIGQKVANLDVLCHDLPPETASTDSSDSTFSDTLDLLSVFAKASLILTGNAKPASLIPDQEFFVPSADLTPDASPLTIHSSPNHPIRSHQDIGRNRLATFDFRYFDMTQYWLDCLVIELPCRL